MNSKELKTLHSLIKRARSQRNATTTNEDFIKSLPEKFMEDCNQSCRYFHSNLKEMVEIALN